MNKRPAVPPLTPAQAQYVLALAVADRKLRYNDIVSYLAQSAKEARELEFRLAQLRQVMQDSAPRGSRKKTARTQRTLKKTHAKKSKSISPQHRASMQLQGAYLGRLRRMPESQKASIRKLAREKGREAAITLMNKSLKKSSKP